MSSQVTSTDTVQHFIALLSTNGSCTDPSNSCTLITESLKDTVTSIELIILYQTYSCIYVGMYIHTYILELDANMVPTYIKPPKQLLP